MKIAWIGTGVMGRSMLLNIKNGGHEVSAYNRTYEKAAELEACGVKAYKTIGECVSGADMVFTIVGFPADVESVYLGSGGIFDHAAPNTILVDMTTSSPNLAETIYEEGKKRGFRVLDAPVSGGDSGAKAGTLSIMVGGDKETFDEAMPIFELMGKNIIHMGKAGNGQHTKAANQIAVAGAVAVMTEAMYYAEQTGLNVEDMLNAIKGGAAGSWQINNMAPRVLNSDFAPGFFIKHFVKDMHIVQEVMKEKNLKLDTLDTVCGLYEKLMAENYGDDGTQALIKYYRK